MAWVRELTNTEYWLIGLCIAAYLAFGIRHYFMTKRSGGRSNLFWVKTLFRFTFFGLMITALLGPAFDDMKKEVKVIGKDLFIALDLSQSMLVEDVAPSRLIKAKYEISRLFDQFANDRVGFIVFSDFAMLASPLTFDKIALNKQLSILKPDPTGKGGTNLGSVIELTLQRFKAMEEKNMVVKSKVLVIFSDGEDGTGDWESLIEACKKADLRVFTMGVGTTKGGPIVINESKKLNEDGSPIISKLNRNTLRDLAEQTKGNYYELSDQRQETDKLASAIHLLEGQLKDIKEVDTAANMYQYLLIVALFFLLIDVVFTIRLIEV
jgi:Ca-activated chloride channel family protein